MLQYMKPWSCLDWMDVFSYTLMSQWGFFLCPGSAGFPLLLSASWPCSSKPPKAPSGGAFILLSHEVSSQAVNIHQCLDLFTLRGQLPKGALKLPLESGFTLFCKNQISCDLWPLGLQQRHLISMYGQEIGFWVAVGTRLMSSNETLCNTWKMELKWKQNQQQTQRQTRPGGQFWASGLLRWAEKGKLFKSVAGPLNWILSAAGELRFINVYGRPATTRAHVDTVAAVHGRRTTQLLSTSSPSPFRKQSHDYIRTNVSAVETKPLFTRLCALQRRSPPLSEGLPPFICHEIIKSPLLICGNAAEKKNENSCETNHFDKRSVCAD